MSNTWKNPKTTIGSVATGEYYYPRESIVEQIWNELGKGNSILIAAPRRVGKTSIMRHIEDNPKANYKMLFKNIEGITSANDLYKTIFDMILSCLSNSQSLPKQVFNYVKTFSVTEVDVKGKAKIERNTLDYSKEMDKLIAELNLINNMKIILLLDELPEVLFNIYKSGRPEEANSILKNLRKWRQNAKNKNLMFVLAGSVGIHYVVNTIGSRTSDLNDLANIDCFPLENDEIYTYIEWATGNATVQYNKELIDYLAEMVQYYVPYFLNLMLNEINAIARRNNNPTISKEIIDKAFNVISIDR